LDISIIIVNYRGWKALDECLESINIILSKTFSFEVIIVDNFSNDGQFPVFKQKYSKFTFIENSGNNGFSNGCNFGAGVATGNHFLFLNPDTKLTFEALETLLQEAVSHPEIGILSCLQINENNVFYKQNNLFPALGRFFGISRSLFRKLNTVMDVTGILLIVIQNDYKLRNNKYFLNLVYSAVCNTGWSFY
jgi:GT2 family glycosyltransferase